VNTFKLIFLLFVLNFCSFAQPVTEFKSGTKFGFKRGETIIIEAQYDTTFGFDPENKVALVGKTVYKRNAPRNAPREYLFNYINTRNRKLYIRPAGRTDSVNNFTASADVITQYYANADHFAVIHNGKKYLVNKDFKQLTFAALDKIHFTYAPSFFICESKDKDGMSFFGVITGKGETIAQGVYSRITFNTYDSLIICCTAGIKFNGADDVFSYSGKKIYTSNKHIDHAYKNYRVYKLYHPEVSYLIEDSTMRQWPLKATRAWYLHKNVMVYRSKDEKWFFYDLRTEKKVHLDGKLYWLNNLEDDD
jgi:hypothetical protein